jgi:hypothetical protein
LGWNFGAASRKQLNGGVGAGTRCVQPVTGLKISHTPVFLFSIFFSFPSVTVASCPEPRARREMKPWNRSPRRPWFRPARPHVAFPCLGGPKWTFVCCTCSSLTVRYPRPLASISINSYCQFRTGSAGGGLWRVGSPTSAIFHDARRLRAASWWLSR